MYVLLTNYQPMPRSKQIFVCCRVEESHSPLVANPDPEIKQRVHSKVIGTVLKANKQHKWDVLFDFNNKVKVHSSKLLSIVLFGNGVPLHEEAQEVSLLMTLIHFITCITILIHLLVLI